MGKFPHVLVMYFAIVLLRQHMMMIKLRLAASQLVVLISESDYTAEGMNTNTESLWRFNVVLALPSTSTVTQRQFSMQRREKHRRRLRRLNLFPRRKKMISRPMLSLRY